MSDAFHDREKSEEAKFKMDAEMRFKAHARRNKLLGLWAADRMGMATEKAESYAKDVVYADLEIPGDDDVIAKLMRDFEEAGVTISEREVRDLIAKFESKAMEQLRDQYPDPLGSDHEQVGG